VPHLKVEGKGDKTRFLPLHPGTNALIHDYLDAASHGEDENGALFRPIKNNRGKTLERALTPDAVYKLETSNNRASLRKEPVIGCAVTGLVRAIGVPGRGRLC
jgi:hypothetical protein